MVLTGPIVPADQDKGPEAHYEEPVPRGERAD